MSEHRPDQHAIDYTRQSRFSDPGDHADLFAVLPTDPSRLGAVARNVLVHYRSPDLDLPDTSRQDINARWLASILSIDQRRHGVPLEHERPATERVQGCCRDFTLFCVGVLRSHGIPARSRVGFAGYFVDGWHNDHVIVEAWIDGRWRRFDPELESPRSALGTPTDMGHCSVSSTGFVTAAQVWEAHRRGQIDPDTYGVDPTEPVMRGERFVFNEVIYEVAHRMGDEMLLWDIWGRMDPPDAPVSPADAEWLDEIAQMLIAADEGDLATEHALVDRYHRDKGLCPGPVVLQASPFGEPLVEVDLERR